MKKNSLIFITILVILAVFIVIFVLLTNQGNNEEQNQNSMNQPVSQNENEGYIDLNPEDFYALMNSSSNPVVLDVSPKYQGGHLPGSINYYVGDGSLDAAIPSLDKSKTYLVYCHVDSASILGSEKLVEAGFPNVYRLVGNYSAWIAAGYPVEIFLDPVGLYNGTAIANRSYRSGQFIHRVEIETSDPATDKFFEGWLVKDTPELTFFSTGQMQKITGKYVLEYQSTTDQSEYNQVVITEETETNGLDGIPETHIFEGEFTN